MTINMIRRERLAEIIEEHGNCAQLARLCGYNDSYLRNLLAGRKAMGEKTARRIEHCLGLPERYMDQPAQRTLSAAQYLEQLNQTRRRRLVRLISQHKNVASFCRHYGLNASYYRQIVSEHRDIGEKTARTIEEVTGLPFGWLDMREPPKKAP